MIINRIYEHQNLVAVACFLPGRTKDLSAPLYYKANAASFPFPKNKPVDSTEEMACIF